MSTDRLYIPISCNIHDHIETEAVKRTLGMIIFKNEDSVVQVRDRIRSWESKAGVEYLLTQGGQRIRFDDLIEVFGVSVSRN